MRSTRRIPLTAALAATATVATGLIATAASAAPSVCPVGYLCLVPTIGSTALVPEGTGASFVPSLVVREVTNHTRLTYCVTGTISFALRAGGDLVRPDTVSEVAPAVRSLCLPGAH